MVEVVYNALSGENFLRVQSEVGIAPEDAVLLRELLEKENYEEALALARQRMRGGDRRWVLIESGFKYLQEVNERKRRHFAKDKHTL